MPDVSNSLAPATLPDPWERTPPIMLDGPLERNRFDPVVSGILVLVLGWIVYQVVGAVAMVVLLLADGVSLAEMGQDLPGLMKAYAGVMISANSLGLALGMGLLAVGITRLHATRVGAFLRLRTPDLPLLVLSVVGLVALLPVVQWVGQINARIPQPEFLREMEAMQMELIEGVLASDLSLAFSLLMLAVTPALCEELFFRGYVQRQFERGLGALGGIVLTGFVFGLYHIRLSQLLPLSLLGIYLAYLAWRTGSLWVPIVIHFANNAFAVAAAEFAKNRPDLDISDIEQLQVPWYIALGGLILFAGIVALMQRWAQTLTARQPAASPT